MMLAKVEYLAGGIIVIALAAFGIIYNFDIILKLLEHSEHSAWSISDAIATIGKLRGWALIGIAGGVIGGLLIGWSIQTQRRSEAT